MSAPPIHPARLRIFPISRRGAPAKNPGRPVSVRNSSANVLDRAPFRRHLISSYNPSPPTDFIFFKHMFFSRNTHPASRFLKTDGPAFYPSPPGLRGYSLSTLGRHSR